MPPPRANRAPSPACAVPIPCPCRARAVHALSPCTFVHVKYCTVHRCVPTQTSLACAQVHPDKARKVSSALHYCLAQFEYKFLDAALEYCESVGLDARVDSLDGYLWLAGSFPANTPIPQVVLSMRTYLRACACGHILSHAPCHNHQNTPRRYIPPLARVADAASI